MTGKFAMTVEKGLNMNNTVCLLTDFGLDDNYVAAMKGALLKHAPDAKLIDITHNIPPQNVRLAAFQLYTSYASFEKGTFFIAVVDPGVGSNRKILYVEAGGYHFIAPDNGILSWIFEKIKPEIVLDISSAQVNGKPSQTFHGRDIMAPVAGKIISGVLPNTFGKPISKWVQFNFPEVNKMGSKWTGEVLAIDRYGNLITNFDAGEVGALAESSKPWFDVGVRRLSHAYADVKWGALLAIAGSAGFIEISIRDGNAAQKLNKKVGDKISIEFKT